MHSIKVSNLVVVAYPTPCCGRVGNPVKNIFVVKDIWRGEVRCRLCGNNSERMIAGAWSSTGPIFGFPISRLRKVDLLKKDEPILEEVYA